MNPWGILVILIGIVTIWLGWTGRFATVLGGL